MQALNILTCSILFATFMRRTMAKKVLQLNLSADFHLWGLVSPLRDYRLVYFINKHTGLQLRRLADHLVWLPRKAGEGAFARFGYNDEMDHLLYYVVSNKGQTANKWLIPEYKQVDAWLLVKGGEPESCAPLVKQCQSISHIQTIFPVNPLALQSQHNLIFDDEDLYKDQDIGHTRPSL